MFFTFPRTLAGTPSSRPWVSGSRSGSTVGWSGSRGACSDACCGVLPPTDPVRMHRRGEAAPRAVTEDGNVEISGRDLR